MEQRRLPALAVVALLLAAIATADEPPGPARLEASGESDLSTSAHLGKAVTSLAFPGSPLATEPRDPQDPQDPRDPRDPRDPPPGGAPGPESAPAQRGEGPGPVPDVPSQSSESEEGRESDPDSEEALRERGI